MSPFSQYLDREAASAKPSRRAAKSGCSQTENLECSTGFTLMGADEEGR